MSVLKIKELLQFTSSDLKFHGEKITNAHRQQIRSGIDAEGRKFADYTPQYAKRKAAGKAAPNQISRQIDPPTLQLTGSMLNHWQLIDTKVGNEIKITYGIENQDQAKKIIAHSKGRFGKPSKNSRVTVRKDKARVVAAKQKVGPKTESAILNAFVQNITKNLKRLTNRPTIIRM